MKDNIEYIKAQEGYQMMALSSGADIIIGGGAAGAGKSFVLLIDPLRYISVKNFGAVIFRRTMPMIKAEGGLWDASNKLYRKIRGAIGTKTNAEWNFGNEVKFKFSHMEYEDNKYDWMGAEIPYIGFDELTHFTKSQFFYMLTRNRSTCGVKPCIRATCNPDPDSWVSEFISWWIGEDGYPIPERRGVIRYFTIQNDKYVWGDTVQEVMSKAGEELQKVVDMGDVRPEDIIKSLTFIGGTIFENKALIKADPGYLGSLSAQDEKNKARLLHGNWKVKVSGDDIYDFYKFANIFENEQVLKQLEADKNRLKTLTDRSKQFRLTDEEHKELKELDHKTRRRITTDIAMQGSDKFVVYVWEGKVMIDFLSIDKSTGQSIIGSIKGMAIKYGVANSDICYDNDGVGAFVGGQGGFIDGAIEFKNGGTPIGGEHYNHLKSQCYFNSGSSVFANEYYIPKEYTFKGHKTQVASRLIDEETTLEDRLKYERKAIKRGKPDDDGKLQVIKKSEMKVYLDNQSPDFLDAFMMREYFELNKQITQSTSDEEAAKVAW